MTVYHRGPPETPEGAAWELFVASGKPRRKKGEAAAEAIGRCGLRCSTCTVNA